MLGYLQDSGLSCLKDEWLRTGDIGYCEQGRWFIVDRVKDLIKVRGWQVSPAELESCIIKHQSVEDVAVIGSVCDDFGEQPIAYVQPKLQYPELADEIFSLVRRELASYKAIAQVLFVETIPRTASGKVIRRLLNTS